jgi:hypothetical protein
LRADATERALRAAQHDIKPICQLVAGRPGGQQRRPGGQSWAARRVGAPDELAIEPSGEEPCRDARSEGWVQSAICPRRLLGGEHVQDPAFIGRQVRMPERPTVRYHDLKPP